MLSPDQMALRMSALRDQFLAAMREHEETEHAGEPCMANRLSAVAYLAHCVGIPANDVGLLSFHHALSIYEADCKAGKHQHQEDDQ